MFTEFVLGCEERGLASEEHLDFLACVLLPHHTGNSR